VPVEEHAAAGSAQVPEIRDTPELEPARHPVL
jgi:hypothetical protein